MKKILMFFLAVVTASAVTDLRCMQTASVGLSTPGDSPVFKTLSSLPPEKLDQVIQFIDTLYPDFVKNQQEILSQLTKKHKGNDTAKPGFIQEAVVKTLSGIASYTTKYVLIVATVYLALGYLNCPTVQVFLLNFAREVAFMFGKGAASLVSSVVVGAAGGAVNFAVSHPTQAVGAASIVSAYYWGPVLAITAGLNAFSWMKRHIV